MIRFFFTSLILGSTLISFSQSITKIIGFAPKYIGEKVELYTVEDFFSMKEKTLASTTVREDSLFTFTIFNEKTQKVYIRSKNNKGFMYIQPDATYEVYLPIKGKHDEFRPLGNEVELSFINLPESDINYKILSFEKWKNTFLGTYFYKKNLDAQQFIANLDTFKINVEKAYEKDSSFFFKTYVRYSIAEMDDIGVLNRFEKYNFYIKTYPVCYDNEVYMNYVDAFYKNMFARLPMETNNKVYLGVLKSSPTAIANALATEYTLKNAKILELVMIKALSDSYHKSDFPQTNILSILDSVSKNSLFAENGKVAENLIEKLTEILPGSKAPFFYLSNYADGEKYSLDTFQKKHLYIQFIDLDIRECEKETELLKTLQAKYKDDVEVITIFKKKAKYGRKEEQFLKGIPWKKFEVDEDASILKNYKVQTFPSYVLLDAYGYVVAAPALKPTPNGKYETIDKSFFYIQKLNQEEKE